MSSPTHWVCPSCGALVPVALSVCPGCHQTVSHRIVASPPPVGASEQRIHPRLRALSITTALVGIVAFFLPWLQFSCGPVRLSVSGYDLATGNANEKFGPEHLEEFNRRIDSTLGHATRPKQATTAPRSKQSSAQGEATSSVSMPLLWVVPVACGILFILALLGIPRTATLSVAAVAAAYLAYFWVTGEQQMSDPAYTGGIIEFKWLFGFWAAWLGLVAPAVAALLKPHRGM